MIEKCWEKKDVLGIALWIEYLKISKSWK